VATPGSFLGVGGEGYLRWALVPTLEQCREALRRLDGLERETR
jgi:aspartate/methionine/tyrosine aminotransferase